MWNPFNRNTISNSSASKRSLQLITQKGMPFAYVEAYKALRTNLNFLSGSGDVHAFVVTSTVPEEAKSNVSVNLALALTESGKKVVLVDCDLRKPVLHRYLKAGHNLKGVSNVLSRQVALSDAVKTALEKLQDAGVKVLGAVLTRYDAKKSLKRSDYGYGYYYYNSNYSYGTPPDGISESAAEKSCLTSKNRYNGKEKHSVHTEDET